MDYEELLNSSLEVPANYSVVSVRREVNLPVRLADADVHVVAFTLKLDLRPTGVQTIRLEIAA